MFITHWIDVFIKKPRTTSQTTQTFLKLIHFKFRTGMRIFVFEFLRNKQTFCIFVLGEAFLILKNISVR